MATGVNYSHKYYINGVDLWLTFGIVVEAGNLAELERAPNRKEQWMNNWPDENGTQRYTDKAFFESKTMTLSFVFICNNKAEYLRNSNRFKEFITVGGASGYFELDCILNGKKYKLLYSGNDSVEVLTPINDYPFANAVARYSFNVIDDLLTGVLGGDSNMLDADQFVSVWDTRNLSTGSSDINSVKLPLIGGVSNFTIDWGDGTSLQTITNNTATHTYTAPGIYTIKCKGDIKQFFFNNDGDILKILEIISWGGFKIDTNVKFFGCKNLVLDNTIGVPEVKDNNFLSMFSGIKTKNINNLYIWDTRKIINFGQAFENCHNFNQDLNMLDVSNALYMDYMFGRATVMNQSFDKWNISKVETMSGFLSENTAMSTQNYDKTLLSWSKQSLKRGVSISFGSAKYSAAGKVGRDILVNQFNWTITDGGII